MSKELERVQIAETKAFDLYILENKVLFFDYRKNITMGLEDVKDAYDLYLKHSEGYSYKVLITFGRFTTIEADARKYAEQKRMPTPAQAIVIRNLAQRLLVRFYSNFRKDSHPLKFFENEEDAVEWLNGLS